MLNLVISKVWTLGFFQDSKEDGKKKKKSSDNAADLLNKCLENLKLSPGEGWAEVISQG
jgi:hypothetical protein